MSDRSPLSITYVGHATVLIEHSGVRMLTDPLLRGRIGHIRRVVATPDPVSFAGIDAVLISHVHGDHLDPVSLRLVRARRVLVPAAAQAWRALNGVDGIEPVAVGEQVQVGDVKVEATPAVHGSRRAPGSRLAADPLGYVIGDGRRVYFAGDTDVFDQMSEIAPVDVALLPVWGWGPRVGRGHMDPLRAAQAVRLLRPRVAIPVHWGTYLADTVRRDRRRRLVDPPRVFAAAVAELAPGVRVEVVEPGAVFAM